MSAIIIFNQGVNPQNVLDYIPSNADPAAYVGQTNVLIDPNLISVTGTPIMYWKVVGTALAVMTAGEKAAVDAVQLAAAQAQEQSAALGDLTAVDDKAALIRAFVQVNLNEINLIREWFISFQAVVAAATSLSNLQTRVAALPTMSDRTLQQLVTAIQNILNSGAAN